MSIRFHSFQTPQSYEPIFNKMRTLTTTRTQNSPDEIWFLEHEPVFTQGQAGKAEHILNPQDIPVVQSDRGGQVTYHGPGQIVVYLLLNIRRLKLNIRQLVTAIETAVINTPASSANSAIFILLVIIAILIF